MRSRLLLASMLLVSSGAPFLALGGGEIPAKSLWVDFVRQPTASKHAALLRRFRSCEEDRDCIRKLLPPQKEIEKLYEHVEKGDRFSIDLAIAMMPGTDGGDLEDLAIVLGELLDHDRKARVLLQVMKARAIVAERATLIATSLPVSTYDHDDRTKRVIVNRLNTLLRMPDPDSIELRNRMIMALARYLCEVVGE